MRDFVKVIFYHSKRRMNKKKGTAPIYFRITVRALRSEISTGIFVKPEHFSNGSILPLNEELINYQKLLDKLKTKINIIETDLRLKDDFISAERLKEIIINGYNKKILFNEIAEEFLLKKSKCIDIDSSIKNYKRYESAVTLINEFIKKHYNRNIYPIYDIKQVFADDFYFYCRSEKKHDANYIVRHIGILKQIIDYAVLHDYADKNYLQGYKVKRSKKAPLKHLSIEQVKIIRDTQFSSLRLNNVRDCFLFQCYTGLAYVDLAKFSLQNISVESSGYKWIVINRTKSSTKSTIPLLKEAEAIIDKYKDLTHRADDKIINSGVLPVYSNQKMNEYLKEIAIICNIPKELLCTHTARKTFAMVVLNSGNASIESVSKMLGHTKVSMTQQHYAYVDTKKIANEMQNFTFIKS